MKTIQCAFCPNTFEAKRSDAKRCASCKIQYKKDFAKSERGRERTDI